MNLRRLTKVELIQLIGKLQHQNQELTDKLSVSKAATTLSSGLNAIARQYSIDHGVTTRVREGQIECYRNSQWHTLNQE